MGDGKLVPRTYNGFAGVMTTNRQPLLIALALAGLVAAVYSGVLQCDFVNLDDPNHLLQNPVVEQRDVIGAFTQTPAGLWVPLTWLSFIVEASLAGFQPWLFHLTNLLLHAANAVLVWRWLEGATGKRWPAVVVATLFAVHPLNVESVAWVTERKNVLSTFFWLLALIAHTRFARSRSWRDYAATLIAYAAALMSKPMAVTLPFTLLLLDAWPLGRFTRQNWWRLLVEKIPFVLLAAGATAITILGHRQEAGLVSASSLTFLERFFNAGASYALYLRQLVWPVGLAVKVRHPQEITAFAGMVGWGVVFAVSAIISLLRKREPAAGWGWLWYLGTLLPVIGLVQAGSEASADRFTYVPMLGIFVAVVWTLWPLAHLTAVRACAAAVVIVLSGLTARQIGFWEDGLALFEHASEVNPHSFRARANAGYMNAKAGDYKRAIMHYRAALEVFPGEAETWNNLGAAFTRLGDDERALRAFRQALELNPDLEAARLNIAAAEKRKQSR